MTDTTKAAATNLPFGYISLENDGTIKSYSPFGTGESTPSPDTVVGTHFFKDVLPSPDSSRLQQRFEEFLEAGAEPFMSANVSLKRGDRVRRIHIGFVRSPLGNEVIVTVNPADHEDLPLSAQIRPDPLRGTVADAAGRLVVLGNEDFWHGVEDAIAELEPLQRETVLHRLGRTWGLAHTVRVEGFVQREKSKTLGELEIQIALEYLSGSLAVVGLGLFDVDLGYRNRGLVVVSHRSSPFPALLAGSGGRCCHLLAGFHAGIITYLSGRELSGYELSCSAGAGGTCRFLVATPERLAALRSDTPHPADARLLAELSATQQTPEARR